MPSALSWPTYKEVYKMKVEVGKNIEVNYKFMLCNSCILQVRFEKRTSCSSMIKKKGEPRLFWRASRVTVLRIRVQARVARILI